MPAPRAATLCTSNPPPDEETHAAHTNSTSMANRCIGLPVNRLFQNNEHAALLHRYALPHTHFTNASRARG